MKRVLLQGRDISKSYSLNGGSTPVLERVNVQLYEGDFTVIMGASGAGKSTLLYALSGMDGITGGEITYKGKTVSGLSEKQMAKLRAKEYGFIFQQAHLVSNLTLFENVAVAGYAGGGRPRKVRERASALLTRMQVGEARDRFPAQTSGGETQRAAVARAVVNSPGLIFADEPTGALNKSNGEEVLNLLSGLNAAGQSILMVTHDIRAAVRGARILYLEDGRLLDELALPLTVRQLRKLGGHAVLRHSQPL